MSELTVLKKIKNFVGVSPYWMDTLKMWGLGIAKIPMIAFISPSVVVLDEERCEIRVPLNYRTKNHLGSMYFGALAAGADCAGGLVAWKKIQEVDPNVKLIFSHFEAKFLKRAQSDVHFICNQGREITAFVQKVAASTERHEMVVELHAECPKASGNERIAEFKLGLSLKKKGKKA